MTRFCALVVSLLIGSYLLACPGNDMRGVQGADVIAEGRFISAAKTDLKKHGRPVYIYEIEVSKYFYGTVSTKEPIKIMMLPFSKLEDFKKGEKCLVCLEVLTADDDPGTKCKWQFSGNKDGIQKVTEKRKKDFIWGAESAKNIDAYVAMPVDTTKLTPLEKKMHSIVIPEIDFRCANMHDVINFLCEYSRELDPAKNGKGVRIKLNLPKGSSAPLLHYGMKNGSLYQNLNYISMMGFKYSIKGDEVIVRYEDARDTNSNQTLSE